jgi:hypothetical protein
MLHESHLGEHELIEARDGFISISLTVINAYRATPHRATRHPCNAHWCEWTSDYGLGRRDQTVKTGD